MENILKRTEPPYIEKPDLVLESIPEILRAGRA